MGSRRDQFFHFVTGRKQFNPGQNHQPVSSLIPLRRGVFLCLLTLLSGCGSEKLEDARTVFPVTGVVLYQDQPITDGMVSLTPVNPPSDDKQFFNPRGTVDESGKFQITTYEKGDGAPPGEYKVSFTWVGSLEGVSEDEEDKLPEKLPRKYTNPETSGITITVKEHNNLLSPIELK
ncbi:hypothetical protein Enr10x_10780 [Gimesia panareensis]|uniref:Carboxypeptidase regulatory-like domain-containing protein n=1 Tax=Gimesia panareensis TaxID=2527978 RepID=A0A517Q2C8_9PLAN|nr:hypothetical protein [Gimesia panareensis]QDT25781.1 hypothetical protein Enr10x_10780 [Gimesia panareensis]